MSTSTTALSVTPTTDRPWVHEMVIVHRAFRRELVLLPRLVRKAPATRAGGWCCLSILP